MNGYNKKFEKNVPTSALLRIKTEGWCQPFENEIYLSFQKKIRFYCLPVGVLHALVLNGVVNHARGGQ